MTESVMINEAMLRLDAEREVARICDRLRRLLARDLKRRGLVIGLSGGIDSSVTAGLAVRALGKERVFGLMMPERHSSPDTLGLSQSVADALGIECAREDITQMLETAGCYRRYDQAVRSVIPEYGTGWTSKIAIEGVADGTGFNRFALVAQDPQGRVLHERLALRPYLEIVAATNFKQRIRKMLEYYHADRLNYAVAGTPNRLEFDQGFFVKNGDGAADVKPIAHLYKSQVYQLAQHLDIPKEVRERPPTTDTYSMAQGQDEFFFAVPYQQMDICLYGKNQGFPAKAVADAAGLSEEHVRRIWEDVDRKRSTTAYLHFPAFLIQEIPEISAHPFL